MSNPDATIDSPNAEDVMQGNFSAEDWDLFENNDNIQEQNEEAQKEHDELRQAAASVFGSQEGKKILNHLMEMTIKRSTFSPQYDNPDRMGYFREGQNTIVAYIIQLINEGRTGEPSQPRKDL